MSNFLRKYLKELFLFTAKVKSYSLHISIKKSIFEVNLLFSINSSNSSLVNVSVFCGIVIPLNCSSELFTPEIYQLSISSTTIKILLGW